MSLLAGFDVGIEISREALRRLALRHFPLAPVPGTPPPYELRTGRDDAGPEGPRAYVLIRDLDLELLPQERVALLLAFDNSTLHVGNRLACPLAGTVRIEVPVQLRPVPAGRLLGLDFAAAAVHVALDAASLEVVQKRLGVTLATLPAQVDQIFTTEVQKYGFQSLDVPLKILPGVDGSLGTGTLASTQFERVEVHCLADPDRSRQALALLGTLFAANHAQGNPAGKTETALQPGQDVALHLSDPAFRRFVFCEGLRQGLERYLNRTPGSLAMAQIPGPCGGSGIDVDGVTLTRLEASLGEGVIQVSGSAETSGDCYEAWGSFSGQIALWLQGNTLGATTLGLSTTVTTEVDNFCVLLNGLVAVFTNPAAAIHDLLGTSLSELFAGGGGGAAGAISGAVGSVVGKPFALLSLGALQGVKFEALRITPEALSLAGTWPLSFLARPEPWVDVPVQVSRLNVVGAGVGVYVVTEGCLKGDYGYSEELQDQLASFQLIPSLFGDVFTTDWWVDCGSGAQQVPFDISQSTGTLTFTGVNTHYPLPLTGGSAVVQDVHLTYERHEDRLTLRNVAGEGCFTVTVRPVLKNCAGKKLKTEAWAPFTGDVVTLDGAYYARVTACLYDRVKDYVRRVPDFPVIHPVPVNYPRPEELLRLFGQVMRMDIPDRDQQLRDLITAHGTAFTRALGAPPALRGNLYTLPAPASRRTR
ncbi:MULTISPECIES: hypothetical protein [Myxococcaceae]|uniref:hypothetical protein n=1 Tax=Myxococcaceae TaxID=31 RepID=UPI00129C2E84|nr:MULTISPECIES: hypothetical protein [Myxococcaceae]MBF5043197.1 hypothetical protein [Simulacricoccus sp. 17bor-14]